MKGLHQSQILSRAADVKDRGSESLMESSPTTRERGDDMTIIDKNPKIDYRLLEETYRLIAEYERLIDSTKGAIRIKQGADYRLSHPLGSNDIPTDPREIGKRLSDVKSR